ncbi:MAG: hypothetical protein CFE25_11145 [Chitinophagaceae bacterium BSSC1]|nr:MAG: hypothetical protein CFE25_11145 [Chitinophagaceae bacterium BSSC1]
MNRNSQRRLLSKIVLTAFWMLSANSFVFAQKKPVFTNADTLINQKDIVDYLKPIFIKDTVKYNQRRKGISDRRVYYSLLPSTTGVPGGGSALVTSTNISFYMGDRKKTTLSELYFTPYTNFQGRYVFPLRSNIWLNGNSWNLLGDLRFLIYPQKSWGLGSNTPDENGTLINYNYFRFYETALKKIAPNLFAGFGVNFDHHSSIHAEPNQGFFESLKPFYDTLNPTSYSTGYNLTLQFDSRKFTNNPLGGMFLSASFRTNPSFLNKTGSWNQWIFDARKYYSFSNSMQNVLAFWAYHWRVGGEYIPYLDLPSTAWDPYARTSRGFYQGRYRSDKHWYFESEYRRDITKNGLLGFVLFANIASFSDFKSSNFARWNAAAGGGIRLKLNKFSRTNIVFDYAFSKEYQTYYLNIGETF